MDKLAKEVSLFDVENHPVGIKIDFSRFLKLKIRAKEICQCYLTGITTLYNSFNRCNIVKCKAANWEVNHGDLNSVDIKDCYLSDCFFYNTIFDNSAIINSIFQNVEFRNCRFHCSSITGSVFRNVTFYECNLCNLVMENCHFYDCSFAKCETSNKLIEQSFLFNSTFESMSIDIDTIIDNFGISQVHMTNIKIKDRKKHLNSVGEIDIERLKRSLEENNNHSKVDKFRIAYFLDYQILNTGGRYIDDVFEVQPWLENCKNSATFSNTLSLFYEFLSYNYEHNKIMLWPLLKFYYLTSNLVQVIQLHGQTIMYPIIMGIHMATVRYVEEYYALLQEFTKQHLRNPIILLVCSGPTDITFYKKLLLPFFENSEVKIVKVIKHNSPNELFLELTNISEAIYNLPWEKLLNIATNLITIYSFFFISRTKVQLDGIKDSILKDLTGKAKSKYKKQLSKNHKNNNKMSKNSKTNTIQVCIEKPSDILDDATKIQIIYPSKNKKNSPILVEIRRESHVICTVGNTIIDILS